MGKNHHKRENYITIIKMICRETKSDIPADLELLSDYSLTSHLNGLLLANKCVGMVGEELIKELQ